MITHTQFQASSLFPLSNPINKKTFISFNA